MRVIVIAYRMGYAEVHECETFDEIGKVLIDEHERERHAIYAVHVQGEAEVATGRDAKRKLTRLLTDYAGEDAIPRWMTYALESA